MCRVEERVYISAEGHRSKFEDTFPCDKSRKGRLCSNVQKRTTEYHPKKGTLVTRRDTPSPITPPTLSGTGTYLTQQWRPSSSSGRPPTRDGQKALRPEIIIEFGSKKGQGKKYPSVSVSTKSYKPSSAGRNSFEDIAVDSPGSDGSHTVRTGYPEAPLAPQMSHGYTVAPTLPYHHPQTSSSSSPTGSLPSLYVTSDADMDSPKTSRTTRQTPAIHYPSTVGEPSSPGRTRAFSRPAIGYTTAIITPKGVSISSETPEGLHARDYLADRSASSHTSSAASSKSRRGKEPEISRKRSDEEEENIKQVRFDIDRQNHRARERAENALAEKEKDRAASREEARRRERAARDEEDRRRERKEREDEEARARRKETERPKPIISNSSSRRPGSRRGSMTMTRAERDEQQRLLAAEMERIEQEQRASEIRDRAERAALLMEQQKDPAYYSARSGGMSSTTTGLARRNSQSRRESFTSEARSSLGRSNSNRRTSIVQPNPPMLNTQLAQGSYQRPPSARTNQGPPISFPANFNTTSPRPPSARRPSFSSQDLPFARSSAASLDNPFAPASSTPVTATKDPWDARNDTRDPVSSTRQSDGRYTIQRRGEDVVSSAARQASRAMGRGMEFSAFETSSEDDDVRTHAPGRRRRA